MDEKFEQRLRDVLNDPPDFPFDEKAWKDLDRRLHGKPPSKWGAMAYLAPLAFLFWLLPFASSWLTYSKLDEANAKIENLKTMLEANAGLSLDTITERHVTVVHDTVYRTVYSNGNIENNERPAPLPSFHQPTVPSLFKNRNNNYPQEQNYAHLLPPSYPSVANSTPPLAPPGPSSPKPGNSAPEKTLPLAPPSSLGFLEMQLLDLGTHRELSLATAPPVFKEKKKGLRYYLYKARPTRFSLGSGYGQYVANFGTGRGFNFFSGIEAEIGYGKNLNLTIGAEYLHWDFDSDVEEDDDHEEHDVYEGFPVVLPTDPDDVLSELYGDFKLIQIPVGLKYVFSEKWKLRPIVGFGVLAQRALRSQLAYGFLTINDEYNINRNNLLPNSFELNSMWGDLGIQYSLNDHWSVQLEGIAQLGVGNGKYKYENLRLFKIRWGLKYDF